MCRKLYENPDYLFHLGYLVNLHRGIAMPEHPRVRVKMGRQKFNRDGLKLFEPTSVRWPWLNVFRYAIQH